MSQPFSLSRSLLAATWIAFVSGAQANDLKVLMLLPFEPAPLPRSLLKTGVPSLKRFADEIVAAMDAVMGGI